MYFQIILLVEYN